MYMHGGLHGAEIETVLSVQKALAQKGFDPGKADGIMGPKTKAAIVAFQKANGLVADGIVGPKTSAKLFTAAAPAISGALLKMMLPAAAMLSPAAAVAMVANAGANVVKNSDAVKAAAAKASATQTANASKSVAFLNDVVGKLLGSDQPLKIGASDDKNSSPANPTSPPFTQNSGAIQNTFPAPPPPPPAAPAAPTNDFLIPALLGIGALALLTMGKK